MKSESSNVKNEGLDLLKEDKDAKKGEMENDKQKKVEQPWTDKERSIIVHHVLTHVLANAGYGNVFSELAEILAKEGCPVRNTKAYHDQWRRKVSKDLLTIYGGSTPCSPTSSEKTPSPSKSAGSPSKRKRVAKKEEKAE
ncbi:hypothetical protein NDA16_004626 [Ustilago loliicola]|nr:hypothetical protein NDA16_004626 [Ustilago loliicola]